MSPRLKICGLTRAEDAKLAAELGAFALGFILYPRSPRYVTPARIRSIIEGVGATAALKVGVFVDASLAEIVSAVTIAGLDAIQLHGSESPAFCARIRAELPQIRIIKAIRARTAADVESARAFDSDTLVLVDTFVDGLPGGTGRLADHDLARAIAAFRPVVLSGGLTSENVGSALAAVQPYALDASSGLESAPGLKSAERMRALFAAAGSGP